MEAGEDSSEELKQYFQRCDLPKLPIRMRGYAVLTSDIVQDRYCSVYLLADNITPEVFEQKFAPLDRTGSPMESREIGLLVIELFNEERPPGERPIDPSDIAASGIIQWGSTSDGVDRTSDYVLCTDGRLLWAVRATFDDGPPDEIELIDN